MTFSVSQWTNEVKGFSHMIIGKWVWHLNGRFSNVTQELFVLNDGFNVENCAVLRLGLNITVGTWVNVFTEQASSGSTFSDHFHF